MFSNPVPKVLARSLESCHPGSKLLTRLHISSSNSTLVTVSKVQEVCSGQTDYHVIKQKRNTLHAISRRLNIYQES